MSKARYLLARHRNLVTPLLWDEITKEAVRSYYDSSPDRALALYDIALAVAKQLNSAILIGRTYYKIGLTNSGIGRYEDAIGALLICRSLFDQAGLRRDLIYILGDLSSLYFFSQDYLKAEACATEALAIGREPRSHGGLPSALPDQYGMAAALSTLGSINDRNGDHLKAIEWFQKSLALYEEIDQGTLQYGSFIADKLSAIGGALNLIGQNGRALVFLTRALEISRKLSQGQITASVLNNLGVLYLDQEDYDRAADYLGKALAIYEHEDNHLEIARVLLNLAVTHQREGQLALALQDFTKSAGQAAEVSSTDLRIAAGEGLGAVHFAMGNYGLALEYLERNLTLARASHEVMRTAELLWRKAEVCKALGRFSDAVVLSEEALELARRFRQPKLMYLVTTTLGESYAGMKETSLAARTLADAVEQMEAIRGSVAGEQQERQLFLGSHIASYHDLVDLLIDQDRPLEALIYAERAKARVLLDAVSGGKRPLTTVLTDQEREEEQRLNRAIIKANKEIRNDQARRSAISTHADEVVKRLDSARMSYAAFNDLMWSRHSEWGSHLTGRPLNYTRLKNLVQDSGVALLEYVMTPDRTWLFVLTGRRGARTQIKVYQVAIRQAELVGAVEQFRRLMSDRRPGYDALARQLFDVLIAPAASDLRDKTSLCIVPDGLLWEVPFQALLAKSGHFLVEDYSLHYAQSLSILSQIGAGGLDRYRHPTLLAFGNPSLGDTATNSPSSDKLADLWEPLPEAETEVRMLGRIVGMERSRVVVGGDATEKTFKSTAQAYSIIHFATHGVLDNRKPLFSYLVLSPTEAETNNNDDDDDGLLEAREIMSMDLKADLAVLSSCETARGKIGAGEGVIGMSWAFFAAGCRTTLVSQWKVDSASTSALMIKFYQYLQPSSTKVRRTKAEALRLASLDLMKDERYRHPFYWAPFVLVGAN